MSIDTISKCLAAKKLFQSQHGIQMYDMLQRHWLFASGGVDDEDGISRF